MTTKYFIRVEARPTIDDVQFSDIHSVNDSTPDDIKKLEEHIKTFGGSINGPFDSMKQAEAARAVLRLNAFKEYTLVIEAALARGTRRPFLVYISNKPGSDLLVYPGYYGILQQAYAKLQELFDVKLITSNGDNITQIYQIIFVRDLAPLVDLSGIWAFKHHPFVDRKPYSISNKLFQYMLYWEMICSSALRLAICKKNPNYPPGEETIETLSTFAQSAGFPPIVSELVEKYYLDLPTDDSTFVLYEFKPPTPTIRNTKTNEAVSLEMLW